MVINIAVQSCVMTFAILTAFYVGWTKQSVEYGRTLALMTMCLSELIRAYTCRSEKFTSWKLGILTNKTLNIATIVCLALLFAVALIPGMRTIFSLAPLDIFDWDWIVGMGIMPFVFGELTKIVKDVMSKDHLKRSTAI